MPSSPNECFFFFFCHLSTQGRASPKNNMEPQKMEVLGRWHMFLFKAICFLVPCSLLDIFVWMNVFDNLQGTSRIPPWHKEYHLQKCQMEGDVSSQVGICWEWSYDVANRWLEWLHMCIYIYIISFSIKTGECCTELCWIPQGCTIETIWNQKCLSFIQHKKK